MQQLRCAVQVVLVAMVVLGPVRFSAGWGREGHEITAMIAEHYLTPEAKKAVRELLGNESMASVSTWADAVRKERRETAKWHYLNIPPDAEGYNRQRDCPNDQCSAEQVVRQARDLADPTIDKSTQKENLKFLIHFVGDLHQPMHCGLARDLGGNTIELTFMGESRNLHWIWDEDLITCQKISPPDYARQLLAEITDRDLAEWRKGTPGQWAEANWRTALQHAYQYEGGTVTNGVKLGRRYLVANLAVLDEQLASGGVRLAWLLNNTYKSAASGTTTRPAKR